MTVQMPSEAMMALIVKKYMSQEKFYTIASTTGAAKYQLWSFVNLTNRRAHIFFVKTPHVWVQKRIIKRLANILQGCVIYKENMVDL